MIESHFENPDQDEWNRLDKTPIGKVQFHIHNHYLQKYIKKGDKVLEIGPGPGRFTIELAKLGTKIGIEEDPANEFHIWIPGGFNPAVIGLIVFAVFWNGFLVFWTWGASRASIVFALFSIPFWLVGFAMIFWIVWELFGKVSIHINSLGIAVVKELFGFSKRTVMPLDTVGDIKVKEQDKSMRQQNASQRGIAIDYGVKTAFVGGGLSEAELQWLAYEMRRFMKKLRR